MKQLKAMKEEYRQVIRDIQEHPEHISQYDLEAMHRELYKKETDQLSVIETARILDLTLEEIYSLIESDKICAIRSNRITILKGEVNRYLSKCDKGLIK